MGESLGSLLNGSLNLADYDSTHNIQLAFDNYGTFVYGNIESINAANAANRPNVQESASKRVTL